MVSSIDIKVVQAAMLLGALSLTTGCAFDAADAEEADLDLADVEVVASSSHALEEEETRGAGGIPGAPVVPGKTDVGVPPVGQVGQGPGVGGFPGGIPGGYPGFPGYPDGGALGYPHAFPGYPGVLPGYPGGLPGLPGAGGVAQVPGDVGKVPPTDVGKVPPGVTGQVPPGVGQVPGAFPGGPGSFSGGPGSFPGGPGSFLGGPSYPGAFWPTTLNEFPASTLAGLPGAYPMPGFGTTGVPVGPGTGLVSPYPPNP